MSKTGSVEIADPEGIKKQMEQANLMVDILGSIIEFRNGESGAHVRHIRQMTELLLDQEEPLVRTAYEICRWHHERYLA